MASHWVACGGVEMHFFLDDEKEIFRALRIINFLIPHYIAFRAAKP